jgi:hypothetical protein
MLDVPVIADDDVGVDLDHHHDQRQRNREHDEKIADREHRLLGVAHRAGPGDELCRAPEEGIGPGRDDDTLHVALLDDAA